jgi:hydroxymethylglutaryl-CoA reductase
MKKRPSSRLPGFHRLTAGERREAVRRWLGDADEEGYPGAGLDETATEQMIENALGVFDVPLGVATNFLINSCDLLVPLAIEEPSVVAAASHAAKIVRAGGGFVADADPPLSEAQVEVLDPSADAPARIAAARAELIELANRTQPELVALGGGLREVVVRADVGTPERMVVHLVLDCRDAMGANMANTMAESVSDRIAELTLGRAGLRIVTNLADRRLARASCGVPLAALDRAGLDGVEVARRVVAASLFAEADPYRAVTHNKGIFNAVDALLLATGNDWRAVEAGAHCFASRFGACAPLARWRADDQQLRGEIELPMPVGIVGGACSSHPVARRSIALLGVESGSELAEVAAAVGLAANLAALAALATEGIQAGHMRLHRRRLE